MGMIQDSFALLWRYFRISSIDLSDVDNEQDISYVGGNKKVEENAMAGGLIGRHHNQ